MLEPRPPRRRTLSSHGAINHLNGQAHVQGPYRHLAQYFAQFAVHLHAAPAGRSTHFFTTRSVHRGISAGSRLRQAARCSACDHSQRVKTRLRQGLSLRNAYRLLHRGVETESSAGDESNGQVQEDPDACQGQGQARNAVYPIYPSNVMSTQWLSALPRVEKFFGR